MGEKRVWRLKRAPHCSVGFPFCLPPTAEAQPFLGSKRHPPTHKAGMWSRVSRAPPIHKHPFSHPLLQEQTSDLTTHPRPFPYGGIIIFFGPRLTCALSGSTKVLSWGAFKENGERKATLLWGCSKNCNPAAMAAMLPSLRRKLICNKNEAEREPEAKDRGGTRPRGPTPPKQPLPDLLQAGDSVGPNPKPGDAARGSWAWHRGREPGNHRTTHTPSGSVGAGPGEAACLPGSPRMCPWSTSFMWHL